MSEETKSKYKVLLPTNGYEVGSVIELTEAEAAAINANEESPRVEAVQADVSEGTPPTPPEPAPETPKPAPEPPAGEPAPEGAGTPAGEEGASAGENNA